MNLIKRVNNQEARLRISQLLNKDLTPDWG
jgi:hypothetical protein